VTKYRKGGNAMIKTVKDFVQLLVLLLTAAKQVQEISKIKKTKSSKLKGRN